jgi:NAD+ synthase
MTTLATFSTDVLAIDAARVTAAIQASIRSLIFERLRRKGAVIGLSGGIDSSVAAALCVRAVGRDRVLGLFMPDADSSGDSLRLGQLLADALGIRSVFEDIAPILRAAGCYQRRDDAIRSVVPEFGDGYKSKMVRTNPQGHASYPFYSIVVQAPDGREVKTRLTPAACLGVVAATNFKQRTRKMIEYYHADRNHYAVVGTPNRLEYDQGFFVKNGDGAADLKPIAHLYKTQVYALARHLGIPEEIQNRLPTTDTYSLEQSQEEFYFSIPLHQMDLCLFGRNHHVPAEEVAAELGWTTRQVEQVYRSIDLKRQACRYQHLQPLLVEPVDEAESPCGNRR